MLKTAKIGSFKREIIAHKHTFIHVKLRPPFFKSVTEPEWIYSKILVDKIINNNDSTISHIHDSLIPKWVNLTEFNMLYVWRDNILLKCISIRQYKTDGMYEIHNYKLCGRLDEYKRNGRLYGTCKCLCFISTAFCVFTNWANWIFCSNSLLN